MSPQLNFQEVILNFLFAIRPAGWFVSPLTSVNQAPNFTTRESKEAQIYNGKKKKKKPQ